VAGAKDAGFEAGVNHATTMTFAHFCNALDYWVLHADPDGSDEDAMERSERRRFSFDETLGGMFSAQGLFDPVSGTVIGGELKRLEQEMFEADWAEAKQRLGRDPSPSELRRTPDQRRADALVQMAIRSGTMPKNGHPPRPLFTVLSGQETLAQLCELASGRVLPPSALAPWLDDAQIERIMFEGAGLRVIDVSRKRSFTGALRRLLEARDRECFHYFCDVPSEDCQADHIIPWSENGPTRQENGRMACGFHNRSRHRRRAPPDDDDPDDSDDDD
jgi:hypothetical protein